MEHETHNQKEHAEKAYEEDRRTPPGEGQPKRLYKITEGSMLVGVANGLGVYLGLDVTLVRIAFVILAIFTQGAAVLLYLILAIVMPAAKTPEDFARAYGNKPNPYGVERRSNDPNEVNSHAYWKKFFNEQGDFWRDFIKKRFGN